MYYLLNLKFGKNLILILLGLIKFIIFLNVLLKEFVMFLVFRYWVKEKIKNILIIIICLLFKILF